MKAPITLALDNLVAEHAAPLLKQAGFRKKGQRFARNSGDCVQIIEFDRWKYNEGTQGRFALTLGVFHPAVWRMVLQARPGWVVDPFDERFPPTQNCLIDFSVLPPEAGDGSDNLWLVDAAQPLDAVAHQLVQALQAQALPWLQEHAVLQATFPRLAELSRKRVWLSSAYLLCAASLMGEQALAEQALSAVLAVKSSRFFPDSERQAFKAIAAATGAPEGQAGSPA